MFINDRFSRAAADERQICSGGRPETGTDAGLPAGVAWIACGDPGRDDLAAGAVVTGMSRGAPS
jgi:hypothetical protein